MLNTPTGTLWPTAVSWPGPQDRQVCRSRRVGTWPASMDIDSKSQRLGHGRALPTSGTERQAEAHRNPRVLDPRFEGSTGGMAVTPRQSITFLLGLIITATAHIANNPPVTNSWSLTSSDNPPSPNGRTVVTEVRDRPVTWSSRWPRADPLETYGGWDQGTGAWT